MKFEFENCDRAATYETEKTYVGEALRECEKGGEREPRGIRRERGKGEREGERPSRRRGLRADSLH